MMRDELTSGTDVCRRCAEVKLAGLLRLPTVRAWLADWRARLELLTRLR
jgi:hypothetical protein